VIPPKPPAVVKPIKDPLDAFFLPHKQREKWMGLGGWVLGVGCWGFRVLGY
jgi:hypothetical protein